MSWKEYTDLEPIVRLRNRGRELLGKIIDWIEKRDGENVSNWLEESIEEVPLPFINTRNFDRTNNVWWKPKISSHNQIEADLDIKNRMEQTPEYEKIVDLLVTERREYNKHFIAYGELMKTVSPTRIERNKKYIYWVLFDIYDLDAQRYLNYEQIYQLAYNYHIPVVRRLTQTIPSSLEDLEKQVKEMKKWCRRHRREGVVLKCYSDQIFAKEKINLPKRPKFEHFKQGEIQYPPMDEHTIMKALQHSKDELLENHTIESWLDKKIIMPIIVKQFSVEGREHNFSTPHNLYQIYLETLNDEKYKSL